MHVNTSAEVPVPSWNTGTAKSGDVIELEIMSPIPRECLKARAKLLEFQGFEEHRGLVWLAIVLDGRGKGIKFRIHRHYGDRWVCGAYAPPEVTSVAEGHAPQKESA